MKTVFSKYSWRIVLSMVSVVAIVVTMFSLGVFSAAAADTTIAMTGSSLELPLENFSKDVWNCQPIKASETVGSSQTKVDKDGSADGDILRLQANKDTSADNSGYQTSSNTITVTGLDTTKEYTVSLYMWGSEKIASANLWINSLNADGTTHTKHPVLDISADVANAATDPWKQVTVTFTPATDTVRFGFWVKNTHTQYARMVYVSDVMLTTEAEEEPDGSLKFTGTALNVPLSAFSKEIYNCKVIPVTETYAGSHTKVDHEGNADANVLVVRVPKDETAENKGTSTSSNAARISGLTAGKTYTTTIWMWSSEKLASGNLWINSIENDVTKTKLTTMNVNEDYDGWKQLSVEFTPDADTVEMAFWLKNTNVDWWRGIYVSEVIVAEKGSTSSSSTSTSTSTSTTTSTTTSTSTSTTTTTQPSTTTTTTRTESYATVIDLTAENLGSSAGLSVGADGSLTVTIEDAEAASKLGWNLKNLENGTYTVTAQVKSDGDFAPHAHIFINPGDKESQISLKEKMDEWTDVVMYDIEVTDGKLSVGVWLRDKTVGKSISIKNLQVKRVGTPTTTTEAPKETYSKVINLPFTAFGSIKNAKMKSKGYKTNTAMYLETPGKDEVAQVGTTITGLDAGQYTLTAWVKTTGGFAGGHIYVNGKPSEGSSAQLTASLKEEMKDWTEVEIKNIEVTESGELAVGVWLKGKQAGQNAYIDLIRLKKVGKGNATGNMTYTKILDYGNQQLGSTAYSVLTTGGYKTKTKVRVSAEEDFKSNNGFKVNDLEPGTYTLTAWVRSSGGHNAAHLFANAGSDSSTEVHSSFAKWEIGEWTQVTVTGIKVSKGDTLRCGLWVNSKAGNWVEIDGIQLKKEGGDSGSPDSGESNVPTVAAIVVVMLSMGALAAMLLTRKKRTTDK